MALWCLSDNGFVFVAIETIHQLTSNELSVLYYYYQILVYDTNMDFEITFNDGITNRNLVLERLNKEDNDTMYKNLLFNNINHDYDYLSSEKIPNNNYINLNLIQNA